MENTVNQKVRAKRARVTKTAIIVSGGLLMIFAMVQGTIAQDTGNTGSATVVKPAAGVVVNDGIDNSGRLKMVVNKTDVTTTKGRITKVSVGQPDIADVNTLGPNTLLVTAKKVGSTQIIIWDDTDHSQVI